AWAPKSIAMCSSCPLVTSPVIGCRFPGYSTSATCPGPGRKADPSASSASYEKCPISHRRTQPRAPRSTGSGRRTANFSPPRGQKETACRSPSAPGKHRPPPTGGSCWERSRAPSSSSPCSAGWPTAPGCWSASSSDRSESGDLGALGRVTSHRLVQLHRVDHLFDVGIVALAQQQRDGHGDEHRGQNPDAEREGDHWASSLARSEPQVMDRRP